MSNLKCVLCFFVIVSFYNNFLICSNISFKKELLEDQCDSFEFFMKKYSSEEQEELLKLSNIQDARRVGFFHDFLRRMRKVNVAMYLQDKEIRRALASKKFKEFRHDFDKDQSFVCADLLQKCQDESRVDVKGCSNGDFLRVERFYKAMQLMREENSARYREDKERRRLAEICEKDS